MFEAFVTLCMLATADVAASVPGKGCRNALLPGFAAETQAACQQAVRAATRPLAGQQAAKAAGPPFCERRPASALAFSEAAPGVFVHRGAIAEPDPENFGDVSNIAFIIGAHSIAVIDSGGARTVGEAVYLAIRERSALPISHLILTHMHPDHVFGAAPLQEAGAVIVGQAKLPRALADRAASYQTNYARLIGETAFMGSQIPAPDRVIVAQETIDLGGRALELRAWSVAHTATDLTVFDPASGILFAGDLLFDVQTPALDGSLRGWLAVLAQMKALPVQRVVPGHGGPLLGWPQAATPVERYLGVLEADTRKALGEGLALGAASKLTGQSEVGRWQLFDLYNPRNATVAYTELEWEP